jgi:hypothetical protein
LQSSWCWSSCNLEMLSLLQHAATVYEKSACHLAIKSGNLSLSLSSLSLHRPAMESNILKRHLATNCTNCWFRPGWSTKDLSQHWVQQLQTRPVEVIAWLPQR